MKPSWPSGTWIGTPTELLHGVNGCDLLWFFPAQVIPARVLVCVCDSSSLSQPHREPHHSLQSACYLQVQACKHMGLTLGMALERVFVLFSTSHHDINVDTAL